MPQHSVLSSTARHNKNNWQIERETARKNCTVVRLKRNKWHLKVQINQENRCVRIASEPQILSSKCVAILIYFCVRGVHICFGWYDDSRDDNNNTIKIYTLTLRFMSLLVLINANSDECVWINHMVRWSRTPKHWLGFACEWRDRYHYIWCLRLLLFFLYLFVVEITSMKP